MASSGVRLALIDDDSGLVAVLDRRLAALGWQREVLGYGASHDQLAALRLHALIVNPAIVGLDYVERMAAALPGLGLLVVATPSPVADRVRALRGGADDWITKPCHPDELVARVEAVLRRRRMGDVPPEHSTIDAGELAIRPDRFDAYANGHPASLSRREYELLHLLASADGRVLEREDVYQRVWGYTMARGDRSVDVFVRKLRLKLEAVSPRWRYVHTHFGVGYRFAAEPLVSAADVVAQPERDTAAAPAGAPLAAPVPGLSCPGTSLHSARRRGRPGVREKVPRDALLSHVTVRLRVGPRVAGGGHGTADRRRLTPRVPDKPPMILAGALP